MNAEMQRGPDAHDRRGLTNSQHTPPPAEARPPTYFTVQRVSCLNCMPVLSAERSAASRTTAMCTPRKEATA